MFMDGFIGRERELERLNRIWSGKGVVTCAVYGRRQIGKSTLLNRFSEGKRTLRIQFSRSSPMENLVRLRSDIGRFIGRDVTVDSITEAMLLISEACKEEHTLLIFDEFPYLVNDFPQVSSIMQRMIDVDLQGTDTMVVICGSSISVMRTMTESMSSPLYGRFTDRMVVGPLPFGDCAKFHPGMEPIDILKLYMVLGGVPKYHKMASWNDFEGCIKELFIDRERDLSQEGPAVITNELSPGHNYTSIVSCIAEGSVKQSTIADKVGIDRGDCKKRLDRLEDIGVVSRKVPMMGAPLKPVYYISDPLVDFHYSVIQRNETMITGPSDTKRKYLEIEHDISTFLGKRFESVCMEWMCRNLDLKAIGTWWGRVGGEDADIDIVASVYGESSKTYPVLAECKFRRKTIGFETLNTLKDRAEAAKADSNSEFMLFSISGFNGDLTEYCEDNGIELVGPECLFEGLGLSVVDDS